MAQVLICCGLLFCLMNETLNKTCLQKPKSQIRRFVNLGNRHFKCPGFMQAWLAREEDDIDRKYNTTLEDLPKI